MNLDALKVNGEVIEEGDDKEESKRIVNLSRIIYIFAAQTISKTRVKSTILSTTFFSTLVDSSYASISSSRSSSLASLGFSSSIAASDLIWNKISFSILIPSSLFAR